jgi:glycosyltransferase involved in cell wall biosynthesis
MTSYILIKKHYKGFYTVGKKLSIAMATCNGEQFIAEQLESIINQSLPPNEIIICDDSRNNLTYNAIVPFMNTSPQLIKYYHNDKQLGVSKNFEKAIALTTGGIVFLSDQDDVWKLDKIEKISFLLNTMEDCDGASCDSKLVDKNLISLDATLWNLRGFRCNEWLVSSPDNILDFFLKRVPTAGHNIAFNSKLKNILLPFPDLIECHDTWIGLIIATISRWSFIDDTLTKFRQHSDNVSGIDRQSKLKEAIASIKNNTFTWHVSLYNELIKRLSQSDYNIKPEVMGLLASRRDHSEVRSKMNCNIIKRLPLILNEMKNKRYFKFGRGWKNVIQDIFLRGLLNLFSFI